jgi:hypothetical protein
MSLRKFFDSFDDTCEPVGLADFQWTAKGIGFGGMYFYFNKEDSYVHCENELMSREFMKQAFCKMVDNCVLDCPGQWDDATEGKPPGYDPKPFIEEPLIVRRTKAMPDDKDITQG